LHYLPATDRYQKMKDELDHVGIDVDSDYFSWMYDYPTPLLDMVFNDNRLNMNSALRSTSRDYIKRVSMKHYEIVKEAYTLGYERILVLENDVRFHRDRDYINTMLLNIPSTDIVMLDKMVSSAPSEYVKYKKYVKSLPEDSLYGDMNESGVFFIFCSCYSLNRKAMEHIIEAHEKNLLPPDTPLNDKTLTGSFAIINLAIQDPKLKTRKSETYDKIGLNTVVYGPVSDEERVVKSDPKPKLTEKTKPAKPAKPKEMFKPKPLFVRGKQLETTPIIKTSKKNKQTINQVKREFLVDKRKSIHPRRIYAKTSGYNKLYDV